MKTFKELEVWQRSKDLAVRTYQLTKDFPKEEIYGLTNQIRRAVVSVPSNISEGAGRNSTKEFINFLGIAKGSLAEVETQFILSHELGYLKLNTEQLDALIEEITIIRRMLIALIKSLELRIGGK